MKIFVTGATGVLGRPVLRLLAAAGHEARGLARSKINAAMIEADGGTPVEGDLFEPWTLRDALAGAEAVLHLATRIPASVNASRADAWAENDRIRRDGTRNLVDLALAGAVGSVVYPSAVFVYRGAGAAWLDAATAAVEPAPILASTLDAEAEIGRFTAAGRTGIVLRMGAFYGPNASLTHDILAAAKRGLSASVGPRHGYQSFLWVEDAAAAVVAALGVPSGIYDVVDEVPMTRAEIGELLAETADKRSVWRMPRPVVRLLAGPVVSAMSRSQRVSNARFKAASGWRPAVPDLRRGFAKLGAIKVT